MGGREDTGQNPRIHRMLERDERRAEGEGRWEFQERICIRRKPEDDEAGRRRKTEIRRAHTHKRNNEC